MSGQTGRYVSQGLSQRKRRKQKIEEWDEASVLEQPVDCRCFHCKIMSLPLMDPESPQLQRRLGQVLNAIDNTTDKIFQDLDDFVVLKTISSDSKYVPDCLVAMDNVRDRLEKMKFVVKTNENPSVCDNDISHKVIFARYFSSPTKNTLLIYAYLDVDKAEMEDGWLGDPFVLKASEGCLYGRGVTTGKGMTVCWLNAIECWLNEYGDLPVNIKIIVESLHEVGSTGLQEYIQMKKDFFLDVDWMVFGNNSWLNDKVPVLSCSLAGWARFGVMASGANKHLEGGLAGGLVYEPMTDICTLMNSLVNNQQELLITKINKMVQPVSHKEWKLLQSADFSEYEYKDRLGLRRLRYELSKSEQLSHRWCNSNITMHGIEGCYTRPGSSTIMPMAVMGIFTIKLVPNQDVAHVHAYLDEYLQLKCVEHEISTDIKTNLLDSCSPFNWRFDNKYTQIAIKAITNVYNVSPALTSSIVTSLPIASLFRSLLGLPIILLPYTQRTDSSQLVNEFIPTQRFIDYVKCCATLMHELSMVPVKCKCGAIREYCNRRGFLEISQASREDAKKSSLPNRSISFLRMTTVSYDERSQESESKATKSPLKKLFCLPFGKKKKPPPTE